MNIESIRAFLEVSSTGSFQKAAENLNITQSAMSARIKSLEETLNRRLFNRKRNGATLTTGGQSFYRHALTVVRTWELARQETALSSDLNAITALGVQLNHWKSVAAPWLQIMKQNSPDIATRVHSDYSDRLMAMLRDGLLNVAILYEPQRNPDLHIEPYLEEQIILVSTEPRAVSQKPIPGYVYVDWGHGFRTAYSLSFPETPSHQMTVGLAEVGLNHILEHGGSGYFLEQEVKHLLEKGNLCKVDDAPVFSLTTYLAYFSDSGDADAIQAALDALEQVRRKQPSFKEASTQEP